MEGQCSLHCSFQEDFETRLKKEEATPGQNRLCSWWEQSEMRDERAPSGTWHQTRSGVVATPSIQTVVTATEGCGTTMSYPDRAVRVVRAVCCTCQLLHAAHAACPAAPAKPAALAAPAKPAAPAPAAPAAPVLVCVSPTRPRGRVVDVHPNRASRPPGTDRRPDSPSEELMPDSRDHVALRHCRRRC